MADGTGAVSSFHFNISLTVLEHLGRNLYRNFSTILGEAISNSWDADAKNVFILMSKQDNSFSIRDDGIGMSRDDFQENFLKIGYTKRKAGGAVSPKGRPYIGRKGIGKLALLSCCEELHIITKKAGGETVGGIINNADLDEAISEDRDSESYNLRSIDASPYRKALDSQESGTYLFFKKMKQPIWHTHEYMRRIIALYFRFSLIDPDFNIFVNDEKVSDSDLQALVSKTEFMWILNDIEGDTFGASISEKIKNDIKRGERGYEEIVKLSEATEAKHISGFIATVKEPKDIEVKETGTGAEKESATLDLFVNGRLREKDILRHVSLTGIVRNYIYGQINCNSLDDGEDRFTSSREGVKEGDEKFQALIALLQSEIKKIRQRWDELRKQKGQEGDSELDEGDVRKTLKRRSKLLYSAGAQYMEAQFKTESGSDDFSDGKEFFDESAKKHTAEGQENIEAYTLCYLCENSMRDYIRDKDIIYINNKFKGKPLSRIIKDFKKREAKYKDKMREPVKIKLVGDDLDYLDMCHLACAIEPVAREYDLQKKYAELGYTPIRNAVMHTSAVTPDAKEKLFTCFGYIKYILR